ncbi:MAG TPA: heme ABC transporter ATP-binding protein, partial [Eubacterium sp.]|nr:heme ABC transporter ATP-binding protein [Eubacterium sp.]
QKKLDKMEIIDAPVTKAKPEFRFIDGRLSGKAVLETTDLVIGYDRPLTRELNFRIERGEKVVIEGSNGIGKTTLLKSILGLIPAYSGRAYMGENIELGYFEQEMSGNGNNTCIEEMWQEFPGFSQYEVRQALSKCGLTTKHIESLVKVLSGGEQAKVRLCKIMNRQTNVLVLDEPTNHLDVDAKDSLKEALKNYKGTVIMVCHDPSFYEGLATRVIDFEKEKG